MNRILLVIIALSLFISCSKDDGNVPVKEQIDSSPISAVDISSYPEIAKTHPTFYNLTGKEEDFLSILSNNGVNTIRLRLWHNPNIEHSGYNEVLQLSKTLKAKGFKIILTLHYSDTWADPGQQNTPVHWQRLNFSALKYEVYNYTTKVVKEIQPHYIQIGNEINSGFLHPYGHIIDHFQQFNDLMVAGIAAVRDHSKSTAIIVHFAGIDGADWFYKQISNLDYDIIGLSYYPMMHGKSLSKVKDKMEYLSETHNKKVLIAETAYPFTLDWNDWTNNIVGLEDQLISPQYPATMDGQLNYMQAINTMCGEVNDCLGFCYWGGELISWKGKEARDGSSWENQALFDFNNRALPALKAFNVNPKHLPIR